MPRRVASLALSAALLTAAVACGQQASDNSPETTSAEREAALATMLRGATLEGSFTMTGPGRDATQLSREKYTLGDVKKLDGNLWLIPTHIQYGDKDLQVPITLPIKWAGDTPVVVVDNVGIPGLGAVSARVMFFADHYAGYWQHGPASGNLFGTIHRAKAAHRDKTAPAAAGDSAD
jgi:hypothetical protein